MKPRDGFTLIEILVVVVLVTLLALIGTINILRTRTTGNETVALSNLRQLAVSLQVYNNVNNSYPAGFTWKKSMYGVRCGEIYPPIPDYGPGQFCLPLTGGTSDVVLGYVYRYKGAAVLAPATSYDLTSDPQTPSVTGTRAFYVNQTTAIRHCVCPATGGCASATSASPTIDQAATPCP